MTTPSTDTDTNIVYLALAGLRLLGEEYRIAAVVLTPEEVRAQQLLRPDSLRSEEGEAWRYYSTKLWTGLRGTRVGAVYKVTLGDGGTISYTRRQLPEFYLPADQSLVGTWDATHRALTAAKRRRSGHDRTARLKALHIQLGPIREAYDALPYNARADLIADVVSFLTRGA